MGVASLSRRGLSGDWMIKGRGLEVTWQLSTNQNLNPRTPNFTLLISEVRYQTICLSVTLVCRAQIVLPVNRSVVERLLPQFLTDFH